MKEKIKKITKLLISAQYGVAITAALVLIAMIGYSVISRYILKSSLMGVEEVMLFPIIWLYMLGGAGASYEKSHIECGVLTLYIKKEKSILIFEFVKRMICVVILTWLVGWNLFYFNYSLDAWKLGDITSTPLFFANIALPVGFGLMLVYAVRDVIEAFQALKTYLRDAKEKGGNQS